MSEGKADVLYTKTKTKTKTTTKTKTKTEESETQTETETETRGIEFSIFAKKVATAASIAIGIGVYYFSPSPENAREVFNALCAGLTVKPTEIVKLFRGSLVVEVLCSSKKRFVKVVDAYQSGNLKTNLSYELSKIGFTDVTVEIKNIKEAIALGEKFR